MITGLLGWFAGKETNKRKYPRKKKPYRAATLLADGVERAAIGVDVSAGGLRFLSKQKIAEPEFDMLIKLEDTVIRARLKVVREEPSTHDGARVWRYGMQFTGIAADDWDAVVRYTTDRPVAEVQSPVPLELARIRMTPDDTARLLPLTLQNKLLAQLVRLRRLAPLDEKVNPLVQYFYSGVVRHDRKLLHHLTIQSKVVDEDANATLFETEFLFDDAGQNISIVSGGPVERPLAKRLGEAG
jgi:hypothetical protein